MCCKYREVTAKLGNGSFPWLDENVLKLTVVAQNIDGGLDSIKKRWKRYEKTAEL